MRWVHIENVDLNLLKALGVLLEERHVSRAASRSHLSQSAMSRTLGRLRETFGDELLVRTGSGYELTPRARVIQRELEVLLPRLQSLVRGEDFDPATATDTVRMHCTDYAATVLGRGLFQELFHRAPHLSVTIEALSPHTFEDIERGRLDLALTPIRPPVSLRWQPLFDEEYVCVLAREHPLTRERLTLADLARFPHVSVAVFPTEVMIADRRLHELGVHPESGLKVPYFSAAVAALPGTTLIAMLPRRFAQRHCAAGELRIADAPDGFEPFAYGMTWHPRLDTDPAHTWVRSLIRSTGEALAGT
jgi:DNA-binding transcriptional LysR family regulator